MQENRRIEQSENRRKDAHKALKRKKNQEKLDLMQDFQQPDNGGIAKSQQHCYDFCRHGMLNLNSIIL